MNGELEKRASDAEREDAISRLRDASAEGRLTLEELAERTALAYRARSHVELEPLTADLPAAAPVAAPVRRRRRWLVSLFAPLSRSGRRAFAERNVVLAIFAPIRLDLRQAELPAGEAVLTVWSIFAPVFVTVPEHVDVDSSVIALLAPVHQGSSGEVSPQAPRVRIRGLSLFGPVFVQSHRR
ncbi:MAG TPA: DUF1707 domain-containing protein [Gaiellaceae bacterium]|nr:DUF1707 domain-containing protein [Gaiellaceae bacterium]